jgi:hypothetical protein
LARAAGSIESQIAIIDRLNLTSFILLNIATRTNPFRTQSWQALAHVAVYRRITIWPTRVINTHRGVFFQRAVEVTCLALRDFAKRHPNAGLYAVYVNAARVRKLSVFDAGWFDCGAHSTPFKDFGFQSADCGLVDTSFAFQSAIRNPKSEIEKTAPSDQKDGTVITGCFSLRRY